MLTLDRIRRIPAFVDCYQKLTSEIPREALIPYCFQSPLRPMQIEWEITELLREVEAIRPRRAVEIGTAGGGTLFLLCRIAHPEAQIISIDLPRGGYGGGYPWLKTPIYKRFAQPGQTLTLMRADSHSPITVAKLKEQMRWPLDYLFIDGDHSYPGAWSDFDMYGPLVRSGGLIAFHDIVKHDPAMKGGVDVFWNEIKGSYRHREIISDPNQTWAGIGLLYV